MATQRSKKTEDDHRWVAQVKLLSAYAELRILKHDHEQGRLSLPKSSNNLPGETIDEHIKVLEDFIVRSMRLDLNPEFVQKASLTFTENLLTEVRSIRGE